SPFSQNKQNEPGVAVDQAHPQYAAAGSNDEIDLEACNAGNPSTCPFTHGVGVSGIYLSDNGGSTFTQPTYQGYTARDCLGPAPCQPHQGPIGTLPGYYEQGLASDGDPQLAFGPQPDGHGGFTYDNGSRLYYANLASNFATQRTEQAFQGFEAIAVSRLDTQNWDAALSGDNTAWKAPVLVSKQNAVLFSDKEAVWADNAQSSPYFGHAYVCNTSFRGQEKGGGAPEPILFYRSTDGGSTFSGPVQLTSATGNVQNPGRQSCTIRTDSRGTIYVYYEGFDQATGQSAIMQVRSFNGGRTFERPHIVSDLTECGLPDPATGRLSFDGVAGARTDSFPSIDIANGAPSGSGASDEIVLTYCNGPTPSDTQPGPNERAEFRYSTDHGRSFSAPTSLSPSSDRPDFPAVAISPNGSDVYATYTNFLQPWQGSTLLAPRLAQGVVVHASVKPGGAVAAFGDLYRGPSGDARGSSQNGLTAGFLGDYNYVVATPTAAIATWNDLRNAADCPAIDTYRQNLIDGTSPNPRPAPNSVCPATFGNSDIYGGVFLP
ncbi:sialidase family protein, partial [Oryzihumus sp.]|uniref:sialidase family protein n=1 Tax=Oryzihumus sp. TaxID=1968903 RepID=UPI002ED8740E